MKKYKKYLDQDEKLNEKYSEYRNKMIKAGKSAEVDGEILTRDQYIAQARGIEQKIRKSLFRIPIPIIIYFLFSNYQTETQDE